MLDVFRALAQKGLVMQPSSYWFPAKRYGWGWGLPNSWHGWVVLVAFVGLLAISGYTFPPGRAPVAFALCVVALCAVLTGICFVKGEPPRWRWGK